MIVTKPVVPQAGKKLERMIHMESPIDLSMGLGFLCQSYKRKTGKAHLIHYESKKQHRHGVENKWE